MFIGDIAARTLTDAARFRQLTYVCMDTWVTRAPETMQFPARRCNEGIMTSLRFPTCWDGKNLDSPDHMSHMSYPETGTFESGVRAPFKLLVWVCYAILHLAYNTQPPRLSPPSFEMPY